VLQHPEVCRYRDPVPLLQLQNPRNDDADDDGGDEKENDDAANDDDDDYQYDGKKEDADRHANNGRLLDCMTAQ